MSVDPPGANGTIKRTGRVGYVCPFAMSGTTGRAAAPAARCRNRRRGSFMVLSQRSFCGTSLPVPFANSERLYPIARWLPRCGNVSSWHCTAQQNPTLSRALRTCRRPGGGSGARAYDPFRKSGTRICCDAQSYGVFLPQQRMERIAIERVLAAKCSLENRPYGGEAQVVSGVGRPAFKVREPSSAQPQILCGALARKTRRILVGRAPITNQTICRGSQGSV